MQIATSFIENAIELLEHFCCSTISWWWQLLYVGQTRCNIRTRLQEHKQAVYKEDANNGIVVHVLKTNDSIEWEKAQVVMTGFHLTRRKSQ